jgi:uncharacterized protein (TIGR03083 family)
LTYESHIAAIRENTDRLVAAATAAGLDAPVPSCPGWTVRDLLEHVASEPYARIAARRTTEPPDFSWFNAAAPSGDPFENARNFGYELADVLSAESEDTPAWTFVGAGVSGFWARRGAHEIVIHRCDAELANGALGSIDPDLAADGVNEFCELQLARVAASMTGAGETAHLHGTDREVKWLLTFAPEGLRVTRTHGNGDVVVRGTASALMLLLWHRISADNVNLEVDGDGGLLDRLLRAAAL